jgi:hypothetical protein
MVQLHMSLLCPPPPTRYLNVISDCCCKLAYEEMAELNKATETKVNYVASHQLSGVRLIADENRTEQDMRENKLPRCGRPTTTSM